MEYLPRIVDHELDALFPYVAAISLDGPKAVGKITTAKLRVQSVKSLDDPGLRQIAQADPKVVLSGPTPILIDEWQKVPAVWDAVRHAVDESDEGGQFILAGSATPVEGSTAHSGAGRIGRLRVRPMTLPERGVAESQVSLGSLISGGREPVDGHCRLTLDDYAEEITASGFPSIRKLPDRARRFQLDSYLQTIVEHEIPEYGAVVRRPEALMAWLRSYAAATSTFASYVQILDAAMPGQSDKPARSTATSYRDLLSKLWLLEPLLAWTPTGSVWPRLTTGPKHHLADPALATRLLGLNKDMLLSGAGKSLDPAAKGMLGPLFESLTTLSLRVFAQALECDVRHFRTRAGDREVDVVVVRPDGGVVACEVKLARAVSDDDVKHLLWLRDKIGKQCVDAIVINTGEYAYRRSDGIAVVPLGILGL